MCWPALMALVFQMRVVLPSLLGNQGKQEHLGLSSSTCCSFLFREHGDFPISSFGNESGHSSFWGMVMLPRDFCGPGKRELQLPLCGSVCRAPPVAGYRDGWGS